MKAKHEYALGKGIDSTAICALAL